MGTINGGSNLVKTIYDGVIRPVLPETDRIVLQNGIPSWRKMKLLDMETNFPNYEDAICESTEQYVDKGSSVVIVGGGKGVTTVKAAKAVGPDGHVTVYEASDEMVEMVSQTIEMNNVDDRVAVEHAVVSSVREGSSNQYGRSTAGTVSPSELPECDVLELDCEGTEIDILTGLDFKPELIIVEVHAIYDAPENEVRDILLNMGYEITDRGVELEEDGVFILTAKQSE